MEVLREPKQLFYRWAGSPSEILYPGNLSTPTPNIACDTVYVPGSIATYYYSYVVNGRATYYGSIYSCSTPVITVSRWFGNNPASGYWFARIYYTDPNMGCASRNFETYINAQNWFISGSNAVQVPRRDLLVGANRITNPSLNTACPTWRVIGGNCPTGSLDCGSCCLDCNSLVNSLNALRI